MITRNDGMWATIRCPECNLHYKALVDKISWQQCCPYCLAMIKLSEKEEEE